jgi:hypothetical protein
MAKVTSGTFGTLGTTAITGATLTTPAGSRFSSAAAIHTTADSPSSLYESSEWADLHDQPIRQVICWIGDQVIVPASALIRRSSDLAIGYL